MAAPKNNKYWMLADWGKPAKYKTPKEMEDKITLYFQKCLKRGKFTPTVSGMTFFLGFESRSSLNDYCKKDEAYSHIIHKAKQFIENCYEGQLYTNTSAGAIFALKNMGWKDKIETENNSTVKVLKTEVEIVPALSSDIATSEKDVKE